MRLPIFAFVVAVISCITPALADDFEKCVTTDFAEKMIHYDAKDVTVNAEAFPGDRSASAMAYYAASNCSKTNPKSYSKEADDAVRLAAFLVDWNSLAECSTPECASALRVHLQTAKEWPAARRYFGELLDTLP